MSDFEKNRADYVVRLEAQIQNLQHQLTALQADARWIPKFGGELDPASEKARLTMSFGGKNQTGVMSYQFLREHSLRDASTNILELAFKDLMFDRMREVIEPEVARLQAGAKSIEGAGKW